MHGYALTRTLSQRGEGGSVTASPRWERPERVMRASGEGAPDGSYQTLVDKH